MKTAAASSTSQKQRGKVLMVGHILEYHPNIRALFDLWSDGGGSSATTSATSSRTG